MSITPKAPTPALPDGLTAVRVAAAPVDGVLGWLDSSEQGLSSAEVSARRARYGPNAVRTHHVNALAVLGRQLRSAVLILLGATAVVSYFLGDSLQAIIIGVASGTATSAGAPASGAAQAGTDRLVQSDPGRFGGTDHRPQWGVVAVHLRNRQLQPQLRAAGQRHLRPQDRPGGSAIQELERDHLLRQRHQHSGHDVLLRGEGSSIRPWYATAE